MSTTTTVPTRRELSCDDPFSDRVISIARVRTSGSDHSFIMGDLVGIDSSIMIGVENIEKPVGVSFHFIDRNHAVMIAVNLLEPDDQSPLASFRTRARPSD